MVYRSISFGSHRWTLLRNIKLSFENKHEIFLETWEENYRDKAMAWLYQLRKQPIAK